MPLLAQILAFDPAHRVANEFVAVLKMELLLDVGPVRVDRFNADVQLFGD